MTESTLTTELHDRNNRVASLKLVMALRSGHAWRNYLLAFYWIYKTFEEEAARIRNHSSDPAMRKLFEGVHEPLLLRADKIKDDLMFYYSDNTSVLRECKDPQVKEYIAHIQTVAKENPIMIMSYLSVMYLALFAGGRIIKSKMISRTGFYPGRPGYSYREIMDNGTNIFSFDTDDQNNLKLNYRAQFDRLCLNLPESDKESIIEESKEIFIRNEQVLAGIRIPDYYWHTIESLRTVICFSAFLLAVLVLIYIRTHETSRISVSPLRAT